MKYVLMTGLVSSFITLNTGNTQEIGIVECDSFLKKYETCTSSLSGADQKQTKEMMQSAVIDMRKQFLDLKSGMTISQMKDICVEQIAGMKETFENLKCN